MLMRASVNVQGDSRSKAGHQGFGESKSKAMKIIKQVFRVGQVAVFLHVFWNKTGLAEVLMFT